MNSQNPAQKLRESLTLKMNNYVQNIQEEEKKLQGDAYKLTDDQLRAQFKARFNKEAAEEIKTQYVQKAGSLDDLDKQLAAKDGILIAEEKNDGLEEELGLEANEEEVKKEFDNQQDEIDREYGFGGYGNNENSQYDFNNSYDSSY